MINEVTANSITHFLRVCIWCLSWLSPHCLVPAKYLGALPQPRPSESVYYFNAFSMAEVTSGESGVTLGSKRAITLPSRPTRNLVKFHLISPPVVGFALESVRY